VLPVLAELSLPALAAVVAGLMLVDGTPLVGLLIPGDLVVVSASTVEGWPAVLVAVVAWTAALVKASFNYLFFFIAFSRSLIALS